MSTLGTIAGKLSEIPAAIFSPLKMAYIGYIVLAAINKLGDDPPSFLTVTAVFIVLVVFHDDWLRIRLNRHAEGWRKWVVGGRDAQTPVLTVQLPAAYAERLLRALEAVGKAQERLEQAQAAEDPAHRGEGL